MANKNLKTLSKFLRKERVSIVVGVGLGVAIASSTPLLTPTVSLSKNTVTVEAVDAEVLADDVRNSLSDTTVPTEDELSKVQSVHITLNARDSLVKSLGYVSLAESAKSADKEYKEYVKEQKRLAREARRKRLAEERRKKRIEDERKRREAEERAKIEAEAETSTSASCSGSKHTAVFEVTAYCNCRHCCGQYSPEVTGKTAHTASGTVPCAGRTVAVDPNVIPLGSTVVINGHSYIAEDTGSAVKGNVIDVFYDSHSDADNWGRRSLEVTYYIK